MSFTTSIIIIIINYSPDNLRHMFFSALLIVWLIYAVLIVRFVRKQLTVGLKNIINEDKEVAKKYDCFARKDLAQWNHFEMYFCAIFLLPVRLFVFLGSLTLCAVLANVALIGENPEKKLPKAKRQFVRSCLRVTVRICLFALGFYRIDHVTKDIATIDPTYKPDAKKERQPAPIVVCNHVSWTDIFVSSLFPEGPSFLAKAAVKKYPLFGTIATAIQTLYVERESKAQRGDIVVRLKERCDAFHQDPTSVPPVLIYPEGTTSNGEYLISFKKGAFQNLTPLKLYGIKYTKKNFSPALDTVGMLGSFFFIILQFYNSVSVYDLGTYYPDQLNLKSEDDWELYAKKIKEIMLKTLDLKSTELGFADFNEYENSLLGKKTN